MSFRLANPFRGLRDSPASLSLTLTCLAVFAMTSISWRISPFGHSLPPLSPYLHYCFGMYLPVLRQGAVWQPFTYIFLHGSLLHLVVNTVMIASFGPTVERLVGSKRFVWLFLLTGAMGGLGWMVCDIFEPDFWMWVQTLPYDFTRAMAQRWGESQTAGMTYGVCVGASASVCGMIGAFAALCPEVRLTVLLFYVIPLRLRARTFAILLAIISLGAAIVAAGRVAHAAHLVGCVAGWIWARQAARRARRRAFMSMTE